MIPNNLKNLDLERMLEEHVENVLEANFNGLTFSDALGVAYSEKYWDTVTERILEDSWNKVSESKPAILHRAVTSSSDKSDIVGFFQDRSFTYEFMIAASVNMEGSSVRNSLRPVRIVANRIENLMKANRFTFPTQYNRQPCPFYHNSSRTVFRNSGTGDSETFGGIDIYLLTMKIDINHA